MLPVVEPLLEERKLYPLQFLNQPSRTRVRVWFFNNHVELHLAAGSYGVTGL